MGFLKNLLGLGVAAGTAYAAVKVAQKYNEKKNANADLNGDGAVDANDTVYGVKEAAREVYAETAAKVREKAPEVREKAAAAIGAVQEKAPEFIEKVKGAAGEAWSAIHGENFPAAEVELEEEPTCSEDVTAEETEEPAAEPETPPPGRSKQTPQTKRPPQPGGLFCCAYLMKLVRMGASRWGRPYFSRPSAMLRIKKVILRASVRMVCRPSSSCSASPAPARGCCSSIGWKRPASPLW